MNKLIVLAALSLSTLAAHAEYNQVNMTVFGMDCAPCAHAIHVSMKGIQGVNKVDVDLNSGLVSIQLAVGNGAGMQQFNQAVEKNGFTHKDAKIVAKGKITGTADAPVFEVAGTNDRYSLSGSGTNVSSLLGKTVSITGTLPQAPKGKVPDTLKYDSISEAK
ncbi:heavy-metal-associated domain-containing protein [Terriglobus roseus]|jgi:copper chaperone CopZ|uniref:Heavy-metal-associated domain-containing protein n=1 Tax=Terriglobus roseus TaxID=392734 RepID=A0A1H4W607_9BACT|nr:heavy metal-associated domain-containing protein [Terriglobus roseus]SEC88655.1 Heavy-metal-associated domain-containing protein [Terriglobus roseus]